VTKRRKAIQDSASAARLTLLYIWRLPLPAPEHGSAPGGFLVPGDVKFEARVAPLVLARPLLAFDSQTPVRYRTKGSFLAPFLGLIGVRLHSKTSPFSPF
jgi:hypothetical protein